MGRGTTRVRWVLLGLGVLLAASTVTACTVSAAGGIIGSLTAVLLAGGLLVGIGSQSGCDDSVEPCLSLALPDAGPAPDGSTDAYVGPCLSQQLPDAGADANVGPCLDPLPWNASADAAEQTPALLEPGTRTVPGVDTDTRARALDRLRDRLPADVVERLDTDE